MAAHLTSARRPCFITRSNTHNGTNGASDQTDEIERAQPEERFVSVSELLAEVRYSGQRICPWQQNHKPACWQH